MGNLYSKTLRHLTPLLVVILLTGCSTTITTKTSRYLLEPQVENDQSSTQIITLEGNKTVELINGNFKMLVFFDFKFFEFRLIIPEGEELFLEESLIVVTDTETQETLAKYQPDWKRLPKENITEEDDTDRLIGLAGSPPATIYGAWALAYFESASVVNLKLPVFRTNENEIVEFGDVSYKISKIDVHNIEKYRWNGGLGEADPLLLIDLIYLFDLLDLLL